ncbi:MAG: hypothetical protein LAT63_10095 [Marinobacter sp.]|nr:hypothetical protein [Marinobacter sp.]
MPTQRVSTTTLCAFFLLFSLIAPAQATSPTQPLTITDDTFTCIRDMTPVRGFFVDNLLGDLDATLAVAHSDSGGRYPPGSVVQLVPTEVMVKHPEGFSPATRDWEFFELQVDSSGSRIAKRGFVDVENKFGGNCFACHLKAEPQWDMICETGRGCDPIPLTAEMTAVLQKADPRCTDNEPLTAQDLQHLQALRQAIEALSAP